MPARGASHWTSTAAVLACVACSATTGDRPVGTALAPVRCALPPRLLRLRGGAPDGVDAPVPAGQRAGTGALPREQGRAASLVVSTPPPPPEAPAGPSLGRAPGRAVSHPLLFVLGLWDHVASRLPPRHGPSAPGSAFKHALEHILHVDPDAELERARDLSAHVDQVIENADWGHVLRNSTLGAIDSADPAVQRLLVQLLSAATNPGVDSVDAQLEALQELKSDAMMRHVQRAAALVGELEAADAQVEGAAPSQDQVRFWKAVEDGDEVDAIRLGT